VRRKNTTRIFIEKEVYSGVLLVIGEKIWSYIKYAGEQAQMLYPGRFGQDYNQRGLSSLPSYEDQDEPAAPKIGAEGTPPFSSVRLNKHY
jgi:hypothetical protein